MSNEPLCNQYDNSKIEPDMVPDIIVKSEVGDVSYDLKSEIEGCSWYSEDSKTDPDLACVGLEVSVESEADSLFTDNNQEMNLPNLEIKTNLEEQFYSNVYTFPVVESQDCGSSDLPQEDDVMEKIISSVYLVPNDKVQSAAGSSSHLLGAFSASQKHNPSMKSRSQLRSTHKKTFACDFNLCHYTTDLKHRLKSHISTKHDRITPWRLKPWKCSQLQCSFATVSRLRLTFHEEGCERWKCKCDKCGLLFQNKSILDAHVKERKICQVRQQEQARVRGVDSGKEEHDTLTVNQDVKNVTPCFLVELS